MSGILEDARKRERKRLADMAKDSGEKPATTSALPPPPPEKKPTE